MLWACAAVSGMMGLAVQRLPLETSLVCIFLFSLGMIYLGIHLGKVKVYDVTQPTPVMSFLVDVSYKRRVFEVLLDSTLIILAYYGSYALVFGRLETSLDPAPFFQSLPLVVAIKLTALTAAGVYRGMWRYITPDALWIYFRGTLLGSMASVVVLTLVFRFQGFSRAAFALDGLLLLLLLTGSRFGFRLIRSLFPDKLVQREFKTVLIYGAGDGGEILARELANNPGWRLRPVGFLDDDTTKSGKILHGLRVLGGLRKLGGLRERLGVTGVIISSSRFSQERLSEIRQTCLDSGLEMFQLSLSINPIISHDDSEEPIQADSFADLPTFSPPETSAIPNPNLQSPNHLSAAPNASI
jgi:UDP-GlcNAc:undecaprenyl-phosphate GlcNAc-1-phosphate transferase